MMVPETSTILAKQAFAAFSTVTAAPLAGTSGSSAARRGQENRQNIPAAIRGASLGERSRARMVIGISFPVSVLTDTRRSAGAPSAKTSPLRPADGLRGRRIERQRNACEFVRAGDMPRDRGIEGRRMGEREHMAGGRQMPELGAVHDR